MFEYLEKLRAKSDKTKKIIAFLVSFLCVAIIFVIWVRVVFPSFTQEKQVEDKVSKLEQSPLSSLGSILSQGFGVIGEQFSKIKQVEQSLGTSTEIYVASTTPAEATTSQN